MITSDGTTCEQITWDAPDGDHPARRASQRSYSAVSRGDLEEWLTVYASDSPTPTPAEASLPSTVLRPLTVAAADMPAFVDQLLGTTLASAALLEPPFAVKDEQRNKTVHFRYDGMLASISIEPAPTTRMTCEVATVCQVDSESILKVVAPTAADGVTSQGVEARRYGYVVSVLSYNAALGKDSPQLSPEPPLSLDQLLLIAGSDVWFN